ncbi:biliverdin-producing heme oxygenase [Larkinella knui]|uniref:Biliverdin-producing heme oxygenase n=1 Tax=Larkinella knui TaxID=2025310 RepID=A0A3P1CAH8_9BACT|nr:biliverdin-producing heme oxygenase [Larkinella knui]RRB10303.1 biliverdin-producing heme oxygenase [Larkinella knui]
MTLAERLRHETRDLHEQTEALLYTEPLRTGTLTPEQYRHLLQVHWVFHHALEAAIDRNPDFFQSYRPDDRRKTPWLESDLAALGVPLPDSIPDLFAHWSPVELLGAAYVGEGSMLGGKVVMHYLQQSLELQPLLPNARFYRGYGSETVEKWKAFNAILAGQVESDQDNIVEAAHRTFRAYHTIFRQAQSQNQALV